MKSSPLLIIVQPELACRSASKILGEQEAQRFRYKLSDAARAWTGSVWVLSGPERETMKDDALFDLHIHSAIRPVRQRFATAPFKRRTNMPMNRVEDIISNLPETIRLFRLSKKVPIMISGCWQEDCDKLKHALEQIGYTVVDGPMLKNPYDSTNTGDDMIYENRLMIETEAPPTLMVVVHPGSACGSANSSLGKGSANLYRAEIASDVQNHVGHILVVDGEFSDELPYYPMFNTAISNAVVHAKHAGYQGTRIKADDESTSDWTVLVANKIEAMGVQTDSPVSLTGAWFCEDDSSGCVNATRAILTQRGFHCTVLDSAARDPEGDLDGEDPDEEYESEDEDAVVLNDRLQNLFGD